MFRRPMLATLLILCLSAACLERKETITVARDGSVRIEAQFEGSRQDFRIRDALPTEATGWHVTKTVSRNGTDELHKLLATQRFEAGAALPATFASDEDPNADLSLRFPTELTTERRPDGLYFHFRRTYSPRRWAYVNYWQNGFLNDDIKKLGDKPSAELTTEERVTLFKAFAGLESSRLLEFARDATDESLPGLPQHHWLAARDAALSVYRDLDYESLVQEYERMSEEDRDERFEAQSDRLRQEADDAFVRSLSTDANLNAAAIRRFADARARAETEYQITNQVGGHAFRIAVRLPGDVVAHNADKMEDWGAIWEFDGTAFRDRPHVLMITSRVPLGAQTDK